MVFVIKHGQHCIAKSTSAQKEEVDYSFSKTTKKVNEIILSNEEKARLLSLLQKKSGNKKVEFTDFQVVHSTSDQGGHGGNLKITIGNQAEQKVHLFLKPLNQTELNNNEYVKNVPEMLDIQEEKFQLRNYTVYAYGSVKINGQSYLVMDNCLNEESQKTSMIDIKLAGLIPGYNPIASKDEHNYTGHKKGWLDYLQMWLGSLFAPNYMVASGPRHFRLFNYRNSENKLKQALHEATKDQLIKLKQQLENMKEAMFRNRVAVIGASILLNKNPDGSFNPLLIDLAHIQVNPEDLSFTKIVTNWVTRQKPAFTGSPEEFGKRIQSNQIAMQSIIKTVEDIIVEKEQLFINPR